MDQTDELTLNIQEITTPSKRKVSEAAKRAQAKWRKSHQEQYKEKCRLYSLRYYARNHDAILEKIKKRNADIRKGNTVVATI